MSFIESNPNLGIVGSVINNLPDKNTLQLYGGLKLNIPRCYVLPCKYGETPDYISGASIFIRTQAIKDAGLFDEKFFMYWEDVDLNLRIKQKGWQIGVAENSIVYHMNGVSSSSLKQEYYSFVSGIYFSWKYSKCFLFTLLVGFLLDRIIRRYPLLLINSLLASYRKWREKKDQ